jgi:hypothetical protein
MIARSKSSEIDSDLAARKGTSMESEVSSFGSCCIRMARVGNRYLDGSEAKVKEVVLRTLFVNATQIDAFPCSGVQPGNSRKIDRHDYASPLSVQ